MRTDKFGEGTKSTWALWLLLAMLVCSVNPANADVVDNKCELHILHSVGVPPEVQNLMDRYKDTISQVCKSASGEIREYYSVSLVRSIRFSVCQYTKTERQLAISDGDRHQLPFSQTPISYMLLTGTNCPRPGSAAYVETSGISAGLFVVISQFWDNATRSKTNFYSVFQNAASNELSLRTFMLLEEMIFGRRTRAEIARIRLVPEEGNLRSAGYELDIPDPEDQSKVLAVYIDLTSNGLKVLALDLIAV